MSGFIYLEGLYIKERVIYELVLVRILCTT